MCLTHWRRLECETGPDYDTLPPSRIGWFARQKAALFRENISGGDDSSLLFWRFPVLSWAKGRLKCTEEDHSLVTPSFFPATRPIAASHVSGGSGLIGCAGRVSGRSELCSFHTVSIWTNSSSTFTVLAERAGKENW